jgi:hypothetical protein
MGFKIKTRAKADAPGTMKYYWGTVNRTTTREHKTQFLVVEGSLADGCQVFLTIKPPEHAVQLRDNREATARRLRQLARTLIDHAATMETRGRA